MKKILTKARKAVPYFISIPTINPIPQDTSLVGIITRIANWVLWIAGALALIYLIYGGIIYITAAGNEDRTKAGRSALLSSIIGIVIIVLALVIIRAVRSLLITSPPL